MTQQYALIDTANTFFRARHVAARNTDLSEKIGMALHLTLASVNMAVRNYGIDHVVFCLEGRSFRRDLYAPYKRNRMVDQATVTEAEKEESEMFWRVYEEFTTYLKERTNVSVLRHERAVADDMIARFIHLHPDDNHYIISTDTDYDQLITEKVVRYNGVGNELVTLNGYLNDKGQVIKDKKTKEPKLLEDPKYLLFRKCLRGDSSDNIFSAFPGIREKGSSKKAGIKETYEDKDKQGYTWTNTMLQRWTDHEGVEHRVLDDYKRNVALIDLTAQPQEIKEAVDARIISDVNIANKPQVGIHFMKFCGKYELNKISLNAETFSKWLASPYKGKLHDTNVT